MAALRVPRVVTQLKKLFENPRHGMVTDRVFAENQVVLVNEPEVIVAVGRKVPPTRLVPSGVKKLFLHPTTGRNHFFVQVGLANPGGKRKILRRKYAGAYKAHAVLPSGGDIQAHLEKLPSGKFKLRGVYWN